MSDNRTTAADRARAGWRPIEVAPRDGTKFLCRWKAPGAEKPETIIAQWTDQWSLGFVGVNVQSGDGRGSISHLTWGLPAKLCATHWMPLPEPPND